MAARVEDVMYTQHIPTDLTANREREKVILCLLWVEILCQSRLLAVWSTYGPEPQKASRPGDINLFTFAVFRAFETFLLNFYCSHRVCSSFGLSLPSGERLVIAARDKNVPLPSRRWSISDSFVYSVSPNDIVFLVPDIRDNRPVGLATDARRLAELGEHDSCAGAYYCLGHPDRSAISITRRWVFD